MSPPAVNIFNNTKLLLLDVDGVLTAGQVTYTGADQESKSFNVKDGLGLRLLIEAGLQVAIITGRSSEALNRRCQELGITAVFDGVRDKAAVLDQALAATNTLSAAEAAFMGDDLPDIPLLKIVGTPVAVADAHPLVRQEARLVTTAPGGHGAVREVCEAILQARGLWPDIIARFI